MKDIIYSRPCVMCGKTHEVELNSFEFDMWYDGGVLIQKAMPNEPAEVREFLISGICPKCQEKIFSTDDDFEEEEEFDENFDFSDFELEEEDLFKEITVEEQLEFMEFMTDLLEEICSEL